MLLRCTLTGFERNFQVRTLSTRISIQRYYTHKAVQQSLSENQNVLQLDPLFITGFIEAEGCFYVGLLKKSSYKTG